MLPKSRRIPRELFGKLVESKRYTHSTSYSLRYLASGETSRAAVSVGKKVSKSAVVRNTVRRRAYSAIRPMLGSLPGGLYLFVAKPAAQRLKGDALSKEIRELLKRL